MLFSDIKLPKPLSKEELDELFLKYQQGDLDAREKLIIHNIKLVITIAKRFSNTPYDLDELLSVGNIGLIKAIDTFDMNKDSRLSIYASFCIENEIKMFLRSNRRHANNISLEQPISTNENGEELKIGDILFDEDSDFLYELEEKEMYERVRKIVKCLPEKERNIIMKYFGFGEETRLTQEVLAKEYAISRSYMTKIIAKILKKIKELLENEEIIEDKIEINEQSKEKILVQRRTLYELFVGYSKEEVDFCFDKLPDADKEIIRLRYGNDLDSLGLGELTRVQSKRFHAIISKMRIWLESYRKSNSVTKEEKREKHTVRREIVMPKKVQTLYEYLKEYTREEIDLVLNGLEEEDKELIRLRYGDDLDNPSARQLNKEETHKFYGRLIPRIKTKLKQARKAKPTKTVPTMNEMFTMLNNNQKDVPTIPEVPEIVEELVVDPVVETPQNDVASNGNKFAIQEAKIESVREITKEDFVKISALLNLPVFINLLDTLTPKEAIVAVFSFGYIDGKYFSIEAIANFLEVSKEEVVEIIQKVVQIYKENVTQSVDKVLKITNKKS